MAKLDRVNALLEGAGEELIAEHEDLLIEAMMESNEFPKHVKAFVLAHPEEFIGENTEDTYKNIRVFTEVAVAQFVNEITTLYGSSIVEEQVVADTSSIEDYL